MPSLADAQAAISTQLQNRPISATVLIATLSSMLTFGVGQSIVGSGSQQLANVSNVTVCAAVPSTNVLPAGASAGTAITISDCAGAGSASAPIVVQASSDAPIAFNPATGRFGAFGSVSFTVPGQAQIFKKTAAGPWAVE